MNDKSEKLYEERINTFHSVTDRLLYLMKRAFLDLELLVYFMSNRVSKSDEDDWKKMKRGLVWVNNKI